MGKLELSIIDFDKAIELDSTNPTIYSNRGLVNRKLEKYEKAVQDYSMELKFCSEPSKNLKALNNRAYCLAKLEKYD
jgi:tetratricopeptide (TPR) repeat protein